MIKNHIINTRNRDKTYWVEVGKKGGGYLPLTSKNKRWHLNSTPENKKHLKTHCWNNVDICQKFEANTHNVLSKQILMWTTLCIWLKHMYSCTRQHTHTLTQSQPDSYQNRRFDILIDKIELKVTVVSMWNAPFF